MSVSFIEFTLILDSGDTEFIKGCKLFIHRRFVVDALFGIRSLDVFTENLQKRIEGISGILFPSLGLQDHCFRELLAHPHDGIEA